MATNEPLGFALSSPMENILNPNKGEFDTMSMPCSSVQEFTINADAKSNSNLTFSTSGLKGVLVDRCIYVEYQVKAVIVSEAAAIDDSQSEISLAQNPLNRVSKTQNVFLNNDSRSQDVHNYVNALSHYHNSYEQKFGASSYPSQPDMYNNCLAQGRNGTSYLPLDSPYIKKYDSTKFARASFTPVSCARSTTTASNDTLTITWKVVEPLRHSLFSDVYGRDVFANIDDIRVELNFTSLLPMVVIGNLKDGTSDAAPSSVAITIDGYLPKLLMRRYQPSVNIPAQVKIPWTRVDVKSYAVSGAATAGSTDGTFSTGNISLGRVPDRMYMFCQRSTDLSSFNQADAYGAITQLSLRTDEGTNLTNATDAQLWQMSTRNGSSQTYKDFTDKQGSVVCVDLNSGDLGTTLIPSSQVPFNIEITGNVSNTTHSGFASEGFGVRSGTTNQVAAWKFYVVLLYREEMLASGDAVELNHGAFKQSQVLETVSKYANGEVSALPYDEHKTHHVSASGWFRNLHKNFNRTAQYIQKGIDYAPKLVRKAAQAKEFVDSAARLTASGRRLDG